MKIKGNLYNLGKFEESKNYFEAEIELSAEELAKQLSNNEIYELVSFNAKRYVEKASKPEPEKCEHEWADLLYSSGGACGCWNTFRCIKCGELKSVENKPEPPKRIEELPNHTKTLKITQKGEEYLVLEKSEFDMVMNKLNELIRRVNGE